MKLSNDISLELEPGAYTLYDSGEQKKQHFYCEKCDYTTFKNSDFEKHLTTKKHIAEKISSTDKNTCKQCFKIYSSASNLWKHKQKCKTKVSDVPTNEIAKSQGEIIIELLKQNNILQKLIIDNMHNIKK
jgi:hypothetical protein